MVAIEIWLKMRRFLQKDLLVMTKVALEDGSEIGFGVKDGSRRVFVTMFTDGWSVDVPESLGEDLSYARTNGLLNGKMVSLQHPVRKLRPGLL